VPVREGNTHGICEDDFNYIPMATSSRVISDAPWQFYCERTYPVMKVLFVIIFGIAMVKIADAGVMVKMSESQKGL
jgi:hypothetical protein